jgi:hypothetical protein
LTIFGEQGYLARSPLVKSKKPVADVVADIRQRTAKRACQRIEAVNWPL